MGVKEVAVSSGSACTSASLEPSYVLRPRRSDEARTAQSRMTVGRFHHRKDIDNTIATMKTHGGEVARHEPDWDMHLEGIDLSTVQRRSDATRRTKDFCALRRDE